MGPLYTVSVFGLRTMKCVVGHTLQGLHLVNTWDGQSIMAEGWPLVTTFLLIVQLGIHLRGAANCMEEIVAIMDRVCCKFDGVQCKGALVT